MTEQVLILGANGRFGRNMAEAFWKAGWRVRLFDRAMDRLPEAAMGADIVVNGWNLTYDRWKAELPALTDRVIEAVRASGATLIQPGNVYVFGADAPARFAEDTPHLARNTLGRLRVEMEAKLRASGIRAILIRGGDFIDTAGSGNWLDKVILAKLGNGRLVYPGDPAIPHAWAYLPDMAKAAVALSDRRETLARFEEVAFPGYTLTGRELTDLVAQAAGRPVALKSLNWLPLILARPFWPMGRHLLEMRYLWDKPHWLDGKHMAELLPGFLPTPADEAIARAVAGLKTPEAPRPPATDPSLWETGARA